MLRNEEHSFAEIPKAEIQRSMFDRSHGHLTSFNCGELIPFFWDIAVPGDTFSITTSIVARMQTLLNPIMSNIYIDTYYFAVPFRLLWEHTKEFFGENTASAWLPTTTYSLPLVSFPSGGWNTGTIADYLGIPTGVYSANQKDYPMALPFRCYAMIASEWFRNQNLTDPLNINTGDSTSAGSNGSSYINDVANGGKPFKVAKLPDVFTKCLPSPQKGPEVNIALVNAKAPVMPSATDTISSIGTIAPVKWSKSSLTDGPARFSMSGNTLGSGTTVTAYQYGSGTPVGFYPINLFADLGASTMASINSLRLAFQLQKFYERSARGGSRYRETILSQFNVTSPDARMQVPEYLGGHRFPLSIHQVANTTQDSTHYLGDLGAMSNTSDIHDDFTKSFTEHCVVMGVLCARYDHVYNQGMEKFWSYRDMLDFYWPVFANIGEQPVKKREIFLTADSAGTGTTNDSVFGYQEAYYEYRMKPSRCSGEMRTTATNSLATWHLADNYATAPSLSDAWIREDLSNVDRVLAVQSSVSNQIFADIWIKNTAVRPMPLFSVPGLIDHH